MKSVTLFYREGSSDKIYQVAIEPNGNQFVVNFAFGRRGSTLSTGTKTQTPVDIEAAGKIFEKLVNEKKAKGYTEGESGTPYQHSEKQSSGILPQLLNPVDEVEASALVTDSNWCMQEKFDGRRMMLEKQGAAIHGINRKGLMVGLPSPVTVNAQKIHDSFIIDGECVGDMFYAFDILERNGQPQTMLPYQLRLDILADLLNDSQHPNIKLVETAYEAIDKATMLTQLKQQNKEGVVFKRLDASYTAGRPNSGGAQLKHKFYATLSAVVAKINKQRSVELRLLNGEGWIPVGNVTIPANASIPKLGQVIEVRYLYAFPQSHCLFQPTYMGTRSHVNQMECLATQLKYKAGDDEQ